MYFDKIKQDADAIIEAGFRLNNLAAEKSKQDLDERINQVKQHIKKILDDIEINAKKQEAELNG